MANKLFYFSDLKGKAGWAATAMAFRKQTNANVAVRVSHVGIPAPEGYAKSGELAHHAATKVKPPRQYRSTYEFHNFAEIHNLG